LESKRFLSQLAAGFGPVIAAAILDRLLHHSRTINIKGESCRLCEKLKTGLVKTKMVADPGSDETSAS
jgi:hypothetical protein